MSGKKAKSADSRSYYSDDYTDYSDSFVSEEDDLPPLKTIGKSTSIKKANSTSTVSGKKSTVSTVKSRNTKNASTRQGTKTSTPRVDYVAKRMLSARRLKINELRNDNENMIQQIQDLKLENKYLKRTQHRQERALEKFEDQDSELPRLIQQHGEEVRTLKEQIRKYKEKLQKSERRKKDVEDEFAKTTKELQKLRTIASDKKLAEREDLTRKLSKTESVLEEKDQKCNELSRHVENLQKNHRRELATEIGKLRELQKENAELKDELQKAMGQIKEKEKELEIKNIYSNRVLKPPHKLPLSANNSPTPSPNKPKKQKKSSPEISPREKARVLEEKRREDEKRKREERLKREKEEKERKNVAPPSMDWDSVQQSYDKDRERRDREEQESRDREERERMEREDRERRDREDRLRREDEERRRRQFEEEEEDLRRERQRMKREAEDRQRREVEERERLDREREDRELREREERERREREDRLERERREREDREERERRDREERQRRAREEADRIANDAKAQEDRRKKDLLLQKMKQIDESKSKGDPIDISPLTKKPVREGGDFPSSAERKPYTFPKPVENLHNGLPSHEDEILEKKNKKKNFVFDDEDDDDSIGYNPSFLTQSKPSPSKNKRNPRSNRSNLMESLFGEDSSKPKSSFGEDDIFSSSTKAKPVSDKKSLPWASDNSTNNNDSLGSPIFGETTTKLLPRRPRQDVSAFHAKPTVNAVDDIDDDIEEVVL